MLFIFFFNFVLCFYILYILYVFIYPRLWPEQLMEMRHAYAPASRSCALFAYRCRRYIIIKYTRLKFQCYKIWVFRDEPFSISNVLWFFPSARENLALVENCIRENRHVTMGDSGNDINGLMGGTIFGEIVWNRQEIRSSS